MKMFIFSLIALLAFGLHPSIDAQSSNMVCYFPNWSRYRSGITKRIISIFQKNSNGDDIFAHFFFKFVDLRFVKNVKAQHFLIFRWIYLL